LRPAPTSVVTGWDDDEVLFSFGDPNCDQQTIRHACTGAVVFGSTGAGKSTGPGATIALSYLGAGMGVIVFCVKEDEARTWEAYAAATGRSDDIVRFGSDPRWAFNFLDYEARRPGIGSGLTENLIQLFVEVVSIGAGETGGARNEDPVWDNMLRSLVRNLLDLLLLAKRKITLADMLAVLRSAPLDHQQASSRSWRDGSVCAQFLDAAEAATKGAARENDFRQTRDYWTNEFPGIPDKMRGSVVTMFTSKVEPLLRGDMATLFCERTTLIPEHVLAGKIVIIDLPVKVMGEIGRCAGVIWKYCFQKAVERRRDNADSRGRPVAIWADEFQFFITKSDFLFQTTARASRVATVYLTQTISGLLAVLGGEGNGKARVDALIANLNTKIFCANSDSETNKWAADQIGKQLINLSNDSTNNGYSGSLMGQGSLSVSHNRSKGRSQQVDYSIQPGEFNNLKTGGPQNHGIVTAIAFQTGRIWSSGKKWMIASFQQPQRL
jgi:hypothetical protein